MAHKEKGEISTIVFHSRRHIIGALLAPYTKDFKNLATHRRNESSGGTFSKSLRSGAPASSFAAHSATSILQPHDGIVLTESEFRDLIRGTCAAIPVESLTTSDGSALFLANSINASLVQQQRGVVEDIEGSSPPGAPPPRAGHGYRAKELPERMSKQLESDTHELWKEVCAVVLEMVEAEQERILRAAQVRQAVAAVKLNQVENDEEESEKQTAGNPLEDTLYHPAKNEAESQQQQQKQQQIKPTADALRRGLVQQTAVPLHALIQLCEAGSPAELLQTNQAKGMLEVLDRMRRAPEDDISSADFFFALMTSQEAINGVFDGVDVEKFSLYLFPTPEMEIGVLRQLIRTCVLPSKHHGFVSHYATERQYYKQDVKEMFFFFPFVILFLCLVVTSKFITERTFYGYDGVRSVQQTFFTPEFEICPYDALTYEASLQCVNSTTTVNIQATNLKQSDWYRWMEQIVAPALFSVDGTSGVTIGNSLIPIGALKLRSHRVVPSENNVTLNLYFPLDAVVQAGRLGTFSRTKYAALSDSSLSKENHPTLPQGAVTAATAPYDGTRYFNCDDLNGTMTLLGNRDAVDCDGHAVILPFSLNRSQVMNAIGTLDKNTWLDAGTRDVIVEFVLFHPTSTMMLYTSVLTEFHTGGGVSVEQHVSPFAFFTYTSVQPIVFGFYCLFFALLLMNILRYVIFSLLLPWLHGGDFGVVSWSAWLLLDVANYAALVVSAAVRIKWMAYGAPDVPIWILDFFPDGYDSAAKDFNLVTIIDGFNVLLTLIGMLRFAKFFPSIRMVVNAFHRAVPDAVVLCLLILGCFIAFSVVALLAFGDVILGYHTLAYAAESLGQVFIGNYDYAPIVAARPAFAYGFFFVFQIVIAVVLLNMFIAVFSDAFNAEVEGAFDRSTASKILDAMDRHAMIRATPFRLLVGGVIARTCAAVVNRLWCCSKPSDFTQVLQRKRDHIYGTPRAMPPSRNPRWCVHQISYLNFEARVADFMNTLFLNEEDVLSHNRAVTLTQKRMYRSVMRERQNSCWTRVQRLWKTEMEIADEDDRDLEVQWAAAQNERRFALLMIRAERVAAAIALLRLMECVTIPLVEPVDVTSDAARELQRVLSVRSNIFLLASDRVGYEYALMMSVFVLIPQAMYNTSGEDLLLSAMDSFVRWEESVAKFGLKASEEDRLELRVRTLVRNLAMERAEGMRNDTEQLKHVASNLRSTMQHVNSNALTRTNSNNNNNNNNNNPTRTQPPTPHFPLTNNHHHHNNNNSSGDLVSEAFPMLAPPVDTGLDSTFREKDSVNGGTTEQPSQQSLNRPPPAALEVSLLQPADLHSPLPHAQVTSIQGSPHSHLEVRNETRPSSPSQHSHSHDNNTTELLLAIPASTVKSAQSEQAAIQGFLAAAAANSNNNSTSHHPHSTTAVDMAAARAAETYLETLSYLHRRLLLGLICGAREKQPLLFRRSRKVVFNLLSFQTICRLCEPEIMFLREDNDVMSAAVAQQAFMATPAATDLQRWAADPAQNKSLQAQEDLEKKRESMNKEDFDQLTVSELAAELHIPSSSPASGAAVEAMTLLRNGHHNSDNSNVDSLPDKPSVYLADLSDAANVEFGGQCLGFGFSEGDRLQVEAFLINRIQARNQQQQQHNAKPKDPAHDTDAIGAVCVEGADGGLFGGLPSSHELLKNLTMEDLENDAKEAEEDPYIVDEAGFEKVWKVAKGTAPPQRALNRIYALFPVDPITNKRKIDLRTFLTYCQVSIFSHKNVSFFRHVCDAQLQLVYSVMWVLFYIPYFLLLMYFIFHHFPSGELAFLTSGLRGTFEPSGDVIVFDDIGVWLENSIASVWPEGTKAAQAHLLCNVFVGAIRVRQHRVNPTDCARVFENYFGDPNNNQLHYPHQYANSSEREVLANIARKQFPDLMERKRCFGAYDYGFQRSWTPFSPVLTSSGTGGGNSSNASTILSTEVLAAFQPNDRYTASDIVGHDATFPHGGFTLELNYSVKGAYAIKAINQLITSGWIDNATRMVALEFVVLNSNIDVFASAKFGYELTSGGAIYPFQQVAITRARLPGGSEYLAVIIFLLIFLIVYLIISLISLTQSGLQRAAIYSENWIVAFFFALVTNVTLLLDFSIIGLGGAMVVLRFISIGGIFLIDGQGVVSNSEWPDGLDTATSASQFFTQVQGVNILFVFIRFAMLFTRIHHRVATLFRTFRMALVDLLTIIALWIFALLTCAIASIILFGYATPEAFNLLASFFDLFNTASGGNPYYTDYTIYRRQVAPPFFVFYFVTCFFVLYNMVVAVLTGKFSQCKDQQYSNEVAERVLYQERKQRWFARFTTMRYRMQSSVIVQEVANFFRFFYYCGKTPLHVQCQNPRRCWQVLSTSWKNIDTGVPLVAAKAAVRILGLSSVSASQELVERRATRSGFVTGSNFHPNDGGERDPQSNPAPAAKPDVSVAWVPYGNNPDAADSNQTTASPKNKHWNKLRIVQSTWTELRQRHKQDASIITEGSTLALSMASSSGTMSNNRPSRLSLWRKNNAALSAAMAQSTLKQNGGPEHLRTFADRRLPLWDEYVYHIFGRDREAVHRFLIWMPSLTLRWAMPKLWRNVLKEMHEFDLEQKAYSVELTESRTEKIANILPRDY